MKLYNVTFTLTNVSLSTTVEAKGLRQAEDLALNVIQRELNVFLTGSRYQVEIEVVEPDCPHAYLGERGVGEDYYCLDCGASVEGQD